MWPSIRGPFLLQVSSKSFFIFRMLKSPLKSSLEEVKPLMVPDMYALQHMKALQETNPALKALVDARGWWYSTTTFYIWSSFYGKLQQKIDFCQCKIEFLFPSCIWIVFEEKFLYQKMELLKSHKSSMLSWISIYLLPLPWIVKLIPWQSNWYLANCKIINEIRELKLTQKMVPPK